MANSFNIVIGGEAGQGLVTIGELLSDSLAHSGYNILVTQSYQSRIRGGHNTFSIRVCEENVVGPSEKIDLLVALNAETVELERSHLNKGATIFLDESFDHLPGKFTSVKVPYSKFGGARALNIAALGVISAGLGLDIASLEKTLDKRFSKKDEKSREENARVLKDSYEWGKGLSLKISSFSGLERHFSNVPEALNGNEAIALGAISAGVRFAAFYPMTPATTVNLNLIARHKEHEIIVEQAEDEIAAINMAIGASFCGAPSMVATSGGGFALMVEAVSLAGMTETPIVIVVAQRPGPATGLPTRTEQADLEFVLYSGHGEFPRAIFAPATPKDCFFKTRMAFELAEKYQTPVFVLTDQYLADSVRTGEPLKKDGLKKIDVGFDPAKIKGEYKRFELTRSGVSPRLIPGRSEHIVVAGSDEHTIDGHLTEDLSVRNLMVQKRLRKLDGMKKDVEPPKFLGPKDFKTLFVCFGSTLPSAMEAAEQLDKTAVLHFSQVWPLVPEHFVKHLKKAKKVVSIEGNATGQLAGLIKKEYGFTIKELCLRYDCIPITAEYILKNVRKI